MNIKYDIIATDAMGNIQSINLNFQEALDFLIERRCVALLFDMEKLDTAMEDKDISLGIELAGINHILTKKYAHSLQLKEEEQNIQKNNLQLNAKFTIEKLFDLLKNDNSELSKEEILKLLNQLKDIYTVYESNKN